MRYFALILDSLPVHKYFLSCCKISFYLNVVFYISIGKCEELIDFGTDYLTIFLKFDPHLGDCIFAMVSKRRHENWDVPSHTCFLT